MVRTRSALFLLLLLCPLVAEAASPGQPISQVRMGISSTTWLNPVSAWSGERFLLAWTSSSRGSQAIVIDAAGRRLTETPFSLPVRAMYIFWDGEAFVVVGGARQWMRVSEDGEVVDAPKTYTLPANGSADAIVWNGSSLFMVLRAAPSYPNFVVTLAVLDRELNLKTSHTYHVSGPTYTPAQIAADGDSVLLLLREGMTPWPQQMYGTLFDRDGRQVAKKPFLIGEYHFVPYVASPGDGSGFLLLSFKEAYFGETSYPAFHVDHGLNVRGLGTITPFVKNYGGLTPLLWDGSAYSTFYTAESKVREMRITWEGGVMSDKDVASTLPGSLALTLSAGGDGNTLLAYTRGSESNLQGTDRYLYARVGRGPDLAAAEEHALERSAFLQETPVAATSATQSVVTWRERLAPTAPLTLFATRVAANGSVVDPASLTVAGSTCDGTQQAIASDGRDFLVAWYDPDGVVTARIGADGSVSPKNRHLFKRPCLSGTPLISWNGTHYLVVWRVPVSDQTEMRAVRVRADGTVVDTVPLEFGRATGNVVLASNGREWVLAWDNFFLRVSPEGTRMDHSGGRSFPGTGLYRIWWNGSTYSVVHHTYPTTFISRIGSDGGVMAKVATFALQAPPMTRTWLYAGGAPACDARGCSSMSSRIEEGRYLLVEDRWEDDGVTASYIQRSSPPVAPATPLVMDNYEMQRALYAAAVRLAGGSLSAAYVRRIPDPPFAGATRIFLHPMEASRSRAVRH